MITDKTPLRQFSSEGQMRNGNQTCGSKYRRTNWWWSQILKQWFLCLPVLTRVYGDLFSILRMTLLITLRRLLTESGDRSPTACSAALESHHAKGQVCLKFALQCISGDDLDFLSLIPPRVQRETASFLAPFPSSNYVSSPVNIWHRVTSLRPPPVSPQTTLSFPGVNFWIPAFCPRGSGWKAEQHIFTKAKWNEDRERKWNKHASSHIDLRSFGGKKRKKETDLKWVMLFCLEYN